MALKVETKKIKSELRKDKDKMKAREIFSRKARVI